MRYQIKPMTHSPLSGKAYGNMARPNADDYRANNNKIVWAHDPWTGYERLQRDIARDPYGYEIVPPGEIPRKLKHSAIDNLLPLDPMDIAAISNGNKLPQHVSMDFITTDAFKVNMEAQSLARALIDPAQYFELVTPKIRNHARRVLGIVYQEPDN